jgi:hypothetical protein
MLPKPTQEFRRRRCTQVGCECVADVSDPCAQCPNGNWGPMLCEGFYAPPEIEKNQHQVPPIDSMVKSAIQSTARWAKNGLRITDEPTLKTRIQTCRDCSYWNSKGFKNTGRCMKCGCSTWAKLRMATEKCPIGKW